MSFNSLIGLGASSADADLVGFWPLDGSNGVTADDISSNGNDMTINNMGSTPATAGGPNTWLPTALDLDGVNDFISRSLSGMGTSDLAYGCWGYNIGSGECLMSVADGFTNDDQTRLFRNSSNMHAQVFDGATTERQGSTVITSTSTWWHFGANFDYQTAIELFVNGSSEGSTSGSSTATNWNTFRIGVTADLSPAGYLGGRVAGAVLFSRLLSSAEWSEIYNGPEPRNITAPTVSGSSSVGSTLTCSPGSWGLPVPFNTRTNGSISYSYQWTRNGSDISGATSSTYTTVSADIGNNIGCKVLGSNNGGSSSAEETASSNTITVTTAFQAAWAAQATRVAW